MGKAREPGRAGPVQTYILFGNLSGRESRI